MLAVCSARNLRAAARRRERLWARQAARHNDALRSDSPRTAGHAGSRRVTPPGVARRRDAGSRRGGGPSGARSASQRARPAQDATRRSR